MMDAAPKAMAMEMLRREASSSSSSSSTGKGGAAVEMVCRREGRVVAALFFAGGGDDDAGPVRVLQEVVLAFRKRFAATLETMADVFNEMAEEIREKELEPAQAAEFTAFMDGELAKILEELKSTN